MFTTSRRQLGRKRRRAPYRNTAFRPPRKRRRARYPGTTRTVGYYGRYAGGGGNELKFFDVDSDDAVISATGSIVSDSLVKIAQGITEKTRVGRKCVIKKIGWRFSLTLPEVDDTATPGASDEVRLILYIDKQTNGATAAVTDILETAVIHSFRNLVNMGRFIILMDRTFAMNVMTLNSTTTGNNSQNAVIRPYQWYKNVNIPIEYNAAAGAITEMCCNNIGLLSISSNAVTQLDGRFRMRFADG